MAFKLESNLSVNTCQGKSTPVKKKVNVSFIYQGKNTPVKEKVIPAKKIVIPVKDKVSQCITVFHTVKSCTDCLNSNLSDHTI